MGLARARAPARLEQSADVREPAAAPEKYERAKSKIHVACSVSDGQLGVFLLCHPVFPAGVVEAFLEGFITELRDLAMAAAAKVGAAQEPAGAEAY